MVKIRQEIAFEFDLCRCWTIAFS